MITGIISEFNPITNGHQHIISTAKKRGDTVVCLMSGNFVQRGEGGILPKHVRAEMALMAGADMVLELPVHFSCSNAETFALGAVKILSLLAVDTILFGSECGDIEKLTGMACFSEDEYFKKSLSKSLAMGATFAKAKSIAHENCGLETAISPNDILGIEYIKAGKKLGFKGEFETILRVGTGHDSDKTSSGYASASYIRSLILSGETEKAREFMPKEAFEILSNSNATDCSSLGILASFQGIYGKGRDEISEVSEGLENLMFQNDFTDFNDYAMKIKSKRYTLARIKRMSIKSILNITKKDVEMATKHTDFAKVLAVKKESTDIFARQCKLKLIRRSQDLEKLNKKGQIILRQMNNADMVYSIFAGSLDTKMIVK